MVKNNIMYDRKFNIENDNNIVFDDKNSIETKVWINVERFIAEKDFQSLSMITFSALNRRGF